MQRPDSKSRCNEFSHRNLGNSEISLLTVDVLLIDLYENHIS